MSEGNVIAACGNGGQIVADGVAIIEPRDVTRYFNVGHGSFGRGRNVLKAVDGVSLSMRRGETLALVGETGSGKKNFGPLLLGLYKPTGGDNLEPGPCIAAPRGANAQTVSR